MQEPSKQLYLNGINGTTGYYLVPPLDTHKADALIKGNPMDPDLARWLGRIWRVSSQPNLGLPMDINAADVSKAGWGIVFHRDEDPTVKDALLTLIEHRRGRVEKDRVKVLEFRKDEGRAQWLARHDISAGTVEPWKVPYYLLLVGSPEKIPFDFGHQLSVEYAIGRICFDTPDDYARYAANLIAYETGATVPNAREAVFFAPRHEFDGATQIGADLLVTPLADGVPSQGVRPAEAGVASRWNFGTRKIWGDAATKAALTQVLAPAAGSKPPAFLFTANHGVGFPKGHIDQLSKQGVLLCQDWPAPGTIDPAHYFSASDLPAGGHVQGLVSFHFACYGAGTPSHDRFLHVKSTPPPAIAERAFFAALPRALMTHPNGGALACIGHVERMGLLDHVLQGHPSDPAVPKRNRTNPHRSTGRLRDEGFLRAVRRPFDFTQQHTRGNRLRCKRARGRAGDDLDRAERLRRVPRLG